MDQQYGSLSPLLVAFALSVVAVLHSWLFSRRVRIRTRRPRSTPAWLIRSIGALGTTLVIASPAGATHRRDPSPLRPIRVAPVQPWSDTGDSPPPPSPVRARAHAQDPGTAAESPKRGFDPDERGLGLDEMVRSDHNHRSFTTVTDLAAGSRRGRVPTAIHPHPRGSQVTPLFPKAGGPGATTEKRACMGRHPSSQSLRETRRYTVRRGDTLWDIAAEVLGTDDVRRIARFWPRIHRLNRSSIGPNPDLLIPGATLLLPREEVH